MKKLRLIISVLAVCVALPSVSSGIPAFARKYGFNCNMCHTAFTKLNDFGQRYRYNGYQLPGQEGLEKNVFETSPPIAFRTSIGLLSSHTATANTSTFNVLGLDLLSAGVLHKNISFLLVYTPRLDEPSATYVGSIGGSDPSQLGRLEAANVIFANLIREALHVRVGKFEPGYHPFSIKRSYYLQQPYDVYSFATPNNSFLFEDNQTGLEATGDLRNGFEYAAGVVNGSGSNPDHNSAKDLYIRLAQVVGRGEGQNAGQRVGLFGYFGWQPTVVDSAAVGDAGANNGKGNKPFRRVGGDLSLNWRNINLFGLFMQGADDKALFTNVATYKFTGGFAQVDYAGLINNRLVASLLYNWVRPMDSDKERQINAYSALARYYLGDWTAVNVALHAEYTHREEGKTAKFKSDNFGMVVDFAF